jgi:NADPH:quinone reductase-like Zn-dependent oxidoreductase
MKAIVYHSHGSPDVLRYEEIEKPEPGDDEVLIKVRAASVNPLDWRLMRGGPFIIRIMLVAYARLLRKPKITRTGRDVAGQVEAVGRNVKRLKPGDEVFGACWGSFAEYACAPERALVTKPENVTFEQGASVAVAALTALQALRDKGQLRPGQKVLINGAAGGVGTFAVQIAKSLGAEVTGVCSNRNLEMVRSIGADHLIDYTREDFTESGQLYDLILDCVGNHSPSALRRVLKPKGRCVVIGAKDIGMALMRGLEGLLLSWVGSRKFILFIAKLSTEDLTFIRDLMAAGKVTPVIDRRYGLSEAPEAVRYLEEGHARGKVVITVERG